MNKSASKLGKKYGLTGEEMNRVLVKLGFLEGDPGNYTLTEKGAKYAYEKDHHSGCGGYSWYNRYWTTRTFDESIEDDLDITDDLIDEVKKELKEKREAQIAERLAFQARKKEEYEAIIAAEKREKLSQEMDAEKIAKNKETIINAGKAGLIVLGIACIGYGIYKLTPKLRKKWLSRKKSEESEKDDEKQQG